MTKDQLRFFNMLMPFHRFRHHWNQLDQSLDIESFEEDLGLMSSGEQHIAKFFASIWLKDNERFPFDLMKAVGTLDNRFKQIIIDWLKDPFYP